MENTGIRKNYEQRYFWKYKNYLIPLAIKIG